MDQYTNYLDALSKPIFSQQANSASTFLSSESHPPSLSASPVSSEGSDSLFEEAMRYGLFGYDPSPAPTYSPYNQKYVPELTVALSISTDGLSIFSSMNNLVADSLPVNGRSSPGAIVKREDPFGYDHQMVFDGGIATSSSPYQPFVGYTSPECNPLSFDYSVHPNNMSSLANMLADSSPFTTVAPSATSGLSQEDTSAYNLSTEIAELSISTPIPSPLYHATSLGSQTSMSMSQPQPTQVCDPKALDAPVTVEQYTTQAGPSTPAEARRRDGASSNRTYTADSDYSPSGESEVEDANDHSFGQPTNRRKTRSVRVSHTSHPYLRPTTKAKGNRRRGTKIEIPVPVPGLTKNSRGRCVPKKTEGAFEDGSRPFWCPVEDCNKLFNRGEHLKRHVSSIHTQDKREALPSRFLLSSC